MVSLRLCPPRLSREIAGAGASIKTDLESRNILSPNNVFPAILDDSVSLL
jgi:hypothetical protein